MIHGILKPFPSIYRIDHPVFTAVASSGADGDSCAVNMDVRTYSHPC